MRDDGDSGDGHEQSESSLLEWEVECNDHLHRYYCFFLVRVVVSCSFSSVVGLLSFSNISKLVCTFNV
jgi:hypothetical protein